MVNGTERIHRTDRRFPPLLKEIAAPPDALYVRGDARLLLANAAVAVVGTRRMTNYGRAVARSFVREWARAGATIVSGLAYGVDAEAHAAALDAGGTTVAVLASGVEDGTVSPRGNVPIAARMLAGGGAIASEYPPGTPAAKHRFPERNRIIAGLSRCVVVIEAPRSSGSLITAYAALDAGRDVFAVPGPVTSPASEGSNRLIARGAYPLTAAADLLEHYGMDPAPSPKASRPDGIAGRVLDALTRGPMRHDAIATATGASTAAATAAVAELELAGLVSCGGGIVQKEN